VISDILVYKTYIAKFVISLTRLLMAHIQFILFGRLVNKNGKTLWKILNSLAYFAYLN